MNDTTNHSFSRREFAALLFGLALTSGAQPISAAVDPAEGYVGKIADDVMSLANSGAKRPGSARQVYFPLEPIR